MGMYDTVNKQRVLFCFCETLKAKACFLCAYKCNWTVLLITDVSNQ